jgi:hypothetical protein
MSHSKQPRPCRWISHLGASVLLGVCWGASIPAASLAAERPPPSEDLLRPPQSEFLSDWSFQLGMAYITRHNIGDLLLGNFDAASGSGEGEIYNLTVNWTAHRFEIPWRDHIFRPQFEPYFTLTLVDEDGRSLFPDYNAGVGFRWLDFPWNRWVKTSFFMGLGLSYSSKVYAIDRVRHPDEKRSHLKFDWPLQLTLALPRWPQHHLVLFNDHQSGGHIFDQGGVNSLGLGYRFEF